MQTTELTISEHEMTRRKASTQGVVGTLQMEGLTLDREALDAMNRYDSGEITLEQMSEQMDAHASRILASISPVKIRGAA